MLELCVWLQILQSDEVSKRRLLERAVGDHQQACSARDTQRGELNKYVQTPPPPRPPNKPPLFPPPRSSPPTSKYSQQSVLAKQCTTKESGDLALQPKWELCLHKPATP